MDQETITYLVKSLQLNFLHNLSDAVEYMIEDIEDDIHDQYESDEDITEGDTHTCTTCGKEKPLSEFGIKNSETNEYYKSCEVCRSKKRKYYDNVKNNNPKKVKNNTTTEVKEEEKTEDTTPPPMTTEEKSNCNIL